MLASSEALWKVALLPCASLPDPLHSRYSCNHMWPSSLAQTPINSWSPLTLMPRGSCYRHPISLMEPKAGRLPTATAPRGQEGPPRENALVVYNLISWHSPLILWILLISKPNDQTIWLEVS